MDNHAIKPHRRSRVNPGLLTLGPFNFGSLDPRFIAPSLDLIDQPVALGSAWNIPAIHSSGFWKLDVVVESHYNLSPGAWIASACISQATIRPRQMTMQIQKISICFVSLSTKFSRFKCFPT